VSRLDWWAADNQGRTPLQLTQAALETRRPSMTGCSNEETKTVITVIQLLLALLQHWRQTERPLLVQSLNEHASLCSDVAQLVLSYVDGQERA
jgi:hypothetical protein